MTKQEMFDKAVRGLRSQGFTVCAEHGLCKYTSNDGTRHCAWGWVDTDLKSETGTVGYLYSCRIGVAATLDADQLSFAGHLQMAHDQSEGRGGMEASLRALGVEHDLIWPEETP